MIGTCAMLAGLLGCGGGNSAVDVSGNAFDFGDVAVSTTVRRIAVTVTNSSTSAVTMSPTLSGGSGFAIASDVSCGKSLAASALCSMIVTFSPITTGEQTTTLDLGMSSNDQSISLKANGVQLTGGQSIVGGTDNPLVARYTYAPQASGNVGIQFGPDTSYGFQTSLHAATAGTPVSFLVAGMRANSTYHMQAFVSDGGSTIETDADHSFTTTNFPDDTLPTLTVTSSGTPQSGVELMNPAVATNDTYLQAYAVDLQGNVVWGYDYPDRTSSSGIQSFKMLPNGDFAVLISLSSQNVTGPAPAGSLVAIREIDLSGVPVRQATLDQINSGLATAGSSLVVYDLHHDFTVTPSGHWVVIGNTIKSYTGLPGATGSTNVLGDVIVDVDTNSNPVWTWSEFDHLDVKRAPAGYPDWTHTNAVLYVPADGSLLVSSRHQSWLMKIDYNNGSGTGDLLWRLGYQGDFTLTNGTEPQDWFFGQHQPSLYGSSTTGTFMITMMDNGFNRQLSPGSPCSGASCYTTAPIFQVDTAAKTATIAWRDTFPASDYSFWGGGTTLLANGDIEIDLCAEGSGSEVDEVTVSSTPTTVWTLKTTGQNLYRANRAPSLYPGVQW